MIEFLRVPFNTKPPGVRRSRRFDSRFYRRARRGARPNPFWQFQYSSNDGLCLRTSYAKRIWLHLGRMPNHSRAMISSAICHVGERNRAKVPDDFCLVVWSRSQLHRANRIKPSLLFLRPDVIENHPPFIAHVLNHVEDQLAAVEIPGVGAGLFVRSLAS